MVTKKTKSKAKPKPKPVPSEGQGPGGVVVGKMGPSFDFLSSIELWQGPPKSGKTSTAAALGPVAEKFGIPGVRPFFMLFERGSGGVEIEGTCEPCGCGGKKGCDDCGGTDSVRKILTTLDEVEEWFEWITKTDYNPVVIDTGDGMYQMVADSVCKRLEISSPAELDHGIAWGQIYDEMREKFGIITGAGKGLIVLMHVYMQEKRLAGGATMSTATFNVSGKTRPYMAGMANQILHFDMVPDGEEDKHIIICESRSGVEAGDHWGVFPPELGRGTSPEEGAEAILKCFYDV